MFNCIILSPAPVVKKLPANVVAINEVSVFKSTADEYAARLRAINRVTAPAFFFLDSDDAYQDMTYMPTTMKVGIERHVNKLAGSNMWYTTSNYSLHKHLTEPQLVHAAWVANTEKAVQILSIMPKEGDYYFHHMFTYLFIKTFGFEHEPRLRYTWEIFPTGLHTQASNAIKNTVDYLINLER